MMSIHGERLSPRHLAELKASAISDRQVAARGYETIANPSTLPLMFTRSCRVPGLSIPIRNTQGELVAGQLKPDGEWTGKDGKPAKYLTAGRICLDVPAAARPFLRDLEAELWITEGCKKVDSAVSNGIPCTIGVQGVWMWREDKVALPDWDDVALKGRICVLAFDSDVMRKASARLALESLAAYLAHRDAVVKYCLMPDLPDGGKCGLDDWFAAGGDRAGLENLIVDALPNADPVWEPPLPLDDPTGPALDVVSLPDTPAAPLRSLVLATARQTQTPPDIAAWCALAVVGAAVRGRLAVQVRKDWVEPVHIQSLQVLISGGGKGPAYRVLTRPLYQWDAKERETWEAAHKEWDKERRLRELNELKARNRAKGIKATADDEKRWQSYLSALLDWQDEEPRRRRIVASNTTAEALERRIHEQGGAMAAISPEGGFLANITGAYSDVPKLGVLLHGYSGEPFENDRVTDNQQWRVPRSCVAVSLAIQPHVMEAMGKVDGFQHLGVAARFLVTCPQPIAWPDLNPPDIPEALTDWWNLRIMQIADGDIGEASDPRPMHLSLGASHAFQAEREWWRAATVRGVFADMPEWGRKYPGQVARVAGLLHILEHDAPHDVPISADTISRAVAILRNAIDHARVAHGLMHGVSEQGRERDVLEVVARLAEDAGDAAGKITSAAVYDRLRGRHAFQKAETVNAALRALEERRYVRLERREGPGPTSFFVILSPYYSPAKMRKSPQSEPEMVDTGWIAGHNAEISHFRSPSGDTRQIEAETSDLPSTSTDGAHAEEEVEW